MAASDLSRSGSLVRTGFLDQAAFRRRLRSEELRARRSGAAFLVLLLESPEQLQGTQQARTVGAFEKVVRDTDAAGWYNEGTVAGVILTEFDAAKAAETTGAVLEDMRARLRAALGEGAAAQIHISHRVYPDQAGSSH